MTSGRPAAGLGHYLRDVIYGATDGVVTTFAIVSAASGATLGAHVVLILGLANLVADGVSMGASNYLGLKSEIQQAGGSVQDEEPVRHGMATFAAFVVAGAIPLLPYFWMGQLDARFELSVLLALVVLTVVGIMRAKFTKQGRFHSAAEILLLGATASAFAFAVGWAGAYVIEAGGWQVPL